MSIEDLATKADLAAFMDVRLGTVPQLVRQLQGAASTVTANSVRTTGTQINVNDGTVVTGMTCTITCTGRPVAMGFSGWFVNASTGVAWNPQPTFRRDGVTIAALNGAGVGVGGSAPVIDSHVDLAPVAGDHTYAVYWDGSGDGTGSSYLSSGHDIRFWVAEL